MFHLFLCILLHSELASQGWQMPWWWDSCQHSIQQLGQVLLTSMTSPCHEGWATVPPGSATYICVTSAPWRPLRGPWSLSCGSYLMVTCLWTVDEAWALWHPEAYNLRLPFRSEDDCSFPILAALLRVTGLVAECLYHSLCTASTYPLSTPPSTPRHPTATCVLCEMEMPPH